VILMLETNSTVHAVREISDGTFETAVLAAERPVLVDFFAGWCGPCHAMAPILEQIAQERAGEVDFAKLDVDANPETTDRFAIKGLPTLILFKAGTPVASQVGAWPKGRLRAWLAESV
jgi:thioredoxin 1